jgi:hypothetical protein
MQQSGYGRAGGVAGSVVLGGSFAGSDGAGVLGGGVLGATLGFSDDDAPPGLGAGWSQALRPSEMRTAAANVNNFMLLLSLETKVLSVMQVLP